MPRRLVAGRLRGGRPLQPHVVLEVAGGVCFDASQFVSHLGVELGLDFFSDFAGCFGRVAQSGFGDCVAEVGGVFDQIAAEIAGFVRAVDGVVADQTVVVVVLVVMLPLLATAGLTLVLRGTAAIFAVILTSHGPVLRRGRLPASCRSRGGTHLFRLNSRSAGIAETPVFRFYNRWGRRRTQELVAASMKRAAGVSRRVRPSARQRGLL